MKLLHKLFKIKNVVMIFLDIIIVIIILYGGYSGYKKGMISQFFGFMMFFLFFYKGIYIYHLSKEFIKKLISKEFIKKLISEEFIKKLISEEFIKKFDINYSKYFLFISIVVSFILIILSSFFLKKMIELILIITLMKPIDRFLGAVLGMLKYFFHISICIFLMKKTNMIPYKFFESSFSNSKIIKIIPTLCQKVLLFFFKKLKELFIL
ncbi:CvpA family protein [Blattabacterium cuenoti]|uniref:CvpA family protein n=1 Tax=Blattabacterium cuenoti TaxID=1653831 RepID=UPI001EEB49F6|nr:CvpA family protein [Blattabacterium cuenoti]